MRLLLGVLVLVGCGDNLSTDYYQDANVPLDCSKATATLVDVASSGLVTSKDTVIPLSPSANGDLMIVAVASDSTDFYGEVSVADSTKTLQIAMSTEPCGKWAYNLAFFDAGPAADAVHVSSRAAGTFVAFVARFSGLSIAEDAHKGRYAWSPQPTGADVEACPGTALVTTSISCSELTLAPESPFTLIDSARGLAAAAYVPSERGLYGATWRADGESSSMTIAFP
ncbi:MAG TPA: hypothetical protein VL326_02910 [Kofleriaceae bacterium]|jgi:hypothetical protein|nr:hypothetical protein [Kofleriaceae bacterium]